MTNRIGIVIAMTLSMALFVATMLFAAPAKPTGFGKLMAKGDGNTRVLLNQGTLSIAGHGELTVPKGTTVKITGKAGTKSEQTMSRMRGQGAGQHGAGTRPPAASTRPPAGGGQGGPGANAQRPQRIMILYKGFDGMVKITAKANTMVTFNGKNIKVTANGKGAAWLSGKGIYTATSGPKLEKKKGSWTTPPTPAANGTGSGPAAGGPPAGGAGRGPAGGRQGMRGMGRMGGPILFGDYTLPMFPMPNMMGGGMRRGPGGPPPGNTAPRAGGAR